MSPKAEEFISNEEIQECLAYGEANKANRELIDEILAKARLRKGVSHKEAIVLLNCELDDKNQEIYELAQQIKKDFYGNRIVMFGRCTFPITASTAANTARIISRTSISHARS